MGQNTPDTPVVCYMCPMSRPDFPTCTKIEPFFGTTSAQPFVTWLQLFLNLSFTARPMLPKLMLPGVKRC